jgi:hypothetical protein
MNRVCTVAIGALFLSGAAVAQDVPAVVKGAKEVAGFVGASYGIDDFRVMGGGNVAWAVTRRIMPYAEFTYFPGIGRTYTQSFSQGVVKYVYSVPLTDFHGGIHIRLPIKESKIVPYLSLGIGDVHASKVTTTANVVLSDGTKVTLGPFTDPPKNEFAGNFGGGFRYYKDEKFGLRVEAKAYKAQGEQVFGKVTVGLFYQIR